MQTNISFRKDGWSQEDIKNTTTWIRHITAEEQNLFLCPQAENTKPLEKLINEILEALTNNYGFIILKNLHPSVEIDISLLSQLFLKFCKKIGTPLIQNKNKEYLFNVREIVNMKNDANARGAQLNGDLPLHADHGGIMGLYCLQNSDVGGETILASTSTVHDTIAFERPDLLEILYQPYYGDRRGQQPEGELPYDINPIFKIKNKDLLCQYVGIYYREAPDKFSDIPKLTPKQIEALDFFGEVTRREYIQFQIKLNIGDVIFANNNKVLHGRTAFTSSLENSNNSRHLIRVWLSTPKIESFPHYYGYPIA